MTRSDRLAELHEELVVGVAALTTSEDWQRFLDVAARFHGYSANNVFLILLQRPDATRVAGFRTWKRLGRQVRRGEKGIRILAPCTYRTSPDGADDPDDTGPGDDTDPTPGRRVLRGFRIVHVFDIAQTDGDPLPEPPVHVLDGEEPDQLTDRLASLIRGDGFSYTLGTLPHGNTGAMGVTQWSERAVTVRDDLPPAQRAKTTAHELAHVRLHQPGTHDLSRAHCEVEAESVAYLICQAGGLRTDAYSFGYVAAWSAGDADLIRATAQRVTTCARAVLAALDPDAPGGPVEAPSHRAA